MSSADRIRSHFEREARRFDAIYRKDKPVVQRVVDVLFRGVVLERFRLVSVLAPSWGEWSALDVGCGPGQHSLAFARSGAVRVVGLDVSETMIALARQEAERQNLGDRCRFVVTRFQEFPEQESFDVVVATGYFDYSETPLADLRKMKALCRGRLFASFPARWELRVPFRMLRFALSGGFVRFYSRREVLALFSAAGFPADHLALIGLGRDLLVIARTP